MHTESPRLRETDRRGSPHAAAAAGNDGDARNPAPLPQGGTSVDAEILAEHVGTVVAQQKHAGFGHILYVADATQRDAGFSRFHDFGRTEQRGASACR